MAEHYYPHQDGKKPSHYLNSPKLVKYAAVAEQFLGRFPGLKVWKIQCKPQGYANNCWYVGLASHELPYLFNFTIIPSNLNIEFRFSQYLDSRHFEKMKWQNNSWRRVDVESYSVKDIGEFVSSYLTNVTPHVLTGKLKSGGRSFAEVIIERDMRQLFPGEFIERNKRLDSMRSDKGRPLEFDVYLPNRKLAIEVQGPQHFKEVYGDNARLQECDQFKKDWCSKNGMNLIWIDWEEYNSRLLRQPISVRLKALGGLIGSVESKGGFISWPS